MIVHEALRDVQDTILPMPWLRSRPSMYSKLRRLGL